MIKKFMIFTAACALATASFALPSANAAEKEAETTLACAKSETLEKSLNEKGYHHLLDMTTQNVVQSLWIGGRSIVATAQVPSQKGVSCLLTTFTEVTLNPVTVTDIYNALQKSQKGI